MRGLLHNDAAAEAYLGWWALAGVDSAVGEEPVNWLSPVVRTPVAGVTSTATAPVEAPLPSTLLTFHDWIGSSPALLEAAWRGTRIMPTGEADAALMVICDMPDAEDADTGTLLSGDSGRLFDAMLAAIGLSRTDIYLASLAVSRPAGGLLSPADSAALTRRMRRQIKLAAPRRMLLLGDKTSRALLSANDTATDLRPAKGLRALNHDGGTMDAVATFHPRLLLRQPAAKAESWRALQNLIEGNRP